jgi:hypothetical protein
VTNPASLCPSLTQSCTCQHPHFAHLPSESSPNQHHSLHSGGLRPTHTLLIEGSRNCLQALHKMVGLPSKRRDSLPLTVPRSSFKPSLLTSRSRFLLEKLSSSVTPNFSQLMETKRSLPYSQKPATFPYTEPDASSLRPPIL